MTRQYCRQYPPRETMERSVAAGMPTSSADRGPADAPAVPPPSRPSERDRGGDPAAMRRRCNRAAELVLHGTALKGLDELGEVGAVPRARPDAARQVRARSRGWPRGWPVRTHQDDAPLSRAPASASVLTGDGGGRNTGYRVHRAIRSRDMRALRVSAFVGLEDLTARLPSPLILLPTVNVVTPGTAESRSMACFRAPLVADRRHRRERQN